MKFSKYLKGFMKEFSIAYGCLMVIAVIFLSVYSIETISTSLLWQLIMAAAAFTFVKFAFVNKYDLGKKSQMSNFFICSTLADLIVVLWLFFFSPGRINDKSLILIYIIVILIVKGVVYAMTYIDGQTQAKLVNEKLSEYKKGSSN